MKNVSRLLCAMTLPLLMCGCQSFSPQPIQPVAAVPSAPGAVGVVHAARRAQLGPAHAQRIVAITDDGDNAVIALRASQAYVRAVTR